MADPGLVEAYVRSVYRVFPPGSPELVLHVGQRHPALDARLTESSSRSWVLITAWNPGSIPRPEQENAAAQRALAETLERAGLLAWPARGESPGREWAEESLCVLDLDVVEARALPALRAGRGGAGRGGRRGAPGVRRLTRGALRAQLDAPAARADAATGCGAGW